jgi:hypothetical protein
VTWADLIAFAARTSTKVTFTNALKAQINKDVLPNGLGNDFPMPRVGVVDGAAPAAAGAIPGAGATAAEWKAAFIAIGLRPGDLAVLGPDVCGPDEAANIAMLSQARAARSLEVCTCVHVVCVLTIVLLRRVQDPELASAISKLAESKAQLGRTSYEVSYARAFEKARGSHSHTHAHTHKPLRSACASAR